MSAAHCGATLIECGLRKRECVVEVCAAQFRSTRYAWRMRAVTILVTLARRGTIRLRSLRLRRWRKRSSPSTLLDSLIKYKET